MSDPQTADAERTARLIEERIAALGMLVDKRIMKLEKKVGELDGKIGDLIARLDGIAPVEARVAEIQAKLDAIQADVTAKVSDIDARVGAVQSKLDERPAPADAPAPAEGSSVDLARIADIERKLVNLARHFEAKVTGMEARMGQGGEAAPAPGEAAPKVDPREIALALSQTPEWKALVDGQFRTMLKHLEGDVIPRIVKKLSEPS